MKKDIRSTILKKRNSMPLSEVIEKSKRIKERVFHMGEYKEAKTILLYVSYDNEVCTHEMIKESLTMKKQVFVPKTDLNNRTIICSSLTSWDNLIPGAYTILEPRQECVNEVPLESIDLMIIPGVAFDRHGNRIGHGMGYYDRLLEKKMRTHCLGLAFEIQIVKNIPTEKHDVKVEKIVTEERIITCY
ncbi:5-formyltetrahydrofolate cyclo-ligase family protein [uncultured archaeon]|nr:5-formyltetrahydrofolate cyclo-ligase family protein [uncultured archaeon]